MGPTMTSPRPVLRFADVGLGDVPSVGGKGASLGELLRAGIRVPDGFVVTTAAFRQAVENLDAQGDIVRRILAPGPAGCGRTPPPPREAAHHLAAGGDIPRRMVPPDPADAATLTATTAEIRAL